METGIIILLAALALGVILFAAGYLKAPPDTAFIISGLGKKRILIGKAGWRIPFLERVDKLSLQVMTVDVKTSEAVPTNEFINVMVDGVANVKISSDPALLTRAAESLLGMKQPQLIAMVTQVLEGNMREIVGSVGLKEMVQDRQGVAKKITENVVPDMEKLGIEVVNFNIQSFRDSAGTIENMGIDNVEQIRKNAQIAKAIAQRDIAIATAQAQEESNAIKVEAEKKIAEQNAALSVQQAQMRVMADTKKAEADAAYSIQQENQRKATFADVAGADEEKAELQEVVEFLKAPNKFNSLGARIPHGVLLVGPPGTGKTLLARACAGEAGVPFYAISGSDFVEMYVGVGASRVRDLFEKAKKTMPSIIFIDEIDAVGRQRGAGLGGGHDEREQTLNQLLVEMDGFDANDGVIVMAATNRADILDKALLRPGRFDRQVYVGLPDVKGREEILRVHTKNKPLGPDVSLKTIARSTAGFSGADLENLVNEAALLAARQGKKAITEKEIEEASVKVMMGPEKKSHVVTDEERRLTAYHETGHAITGYFSKHHDPVHQISIISRGGAGGYTMYLPEKDPSYVTKTAMFENIVTLLGGRVAEQLVLEDISTGASSDLQRATDTARAMVTRYGFSERMGPVVYGSDPGETFLGRDFGQGKGYSEAIASEIDNEIRDIVDEAYETARRTLTEHMNELHKVAGVLMEREKISGEEFKTLMEGGTLPPYDLGRGETAQPEAPAPDSAAPVQPAEQPETQQPAEPANPQPDTQE